MLLLLKLTALLFRTQGTLEYASPESLDLDAHGHLREWGKEGDLWSLGMILHKLLFFKLPFSAADDFDCECSL